MGEAIMQWEIDRKRFQAMKKHGYDEPSKSRDGLLHDVLDDVIRNYGTLVVVSTPDKITVVQRATAEDLDPPSQPDPAGSSEGSE